MNVSSYRRYLILLLLCVAAIGSFAQQATVRSMRLTDGFIPVDHQRRDFNKKLCALVKVQVVDEISSVEGSVMGDIVDRGVEKWVYMAEGTYQFKVHLKNNLPVTVDTRNYGIKSLKSNKVYELVLEVAQRQQFTTGNLLVSCSTGDCDIYIDGQLRQQRWGTNTWITSLPSGRHTVTVRRNGYVEQTQQVNILAGVDTPVYFTALKTVKEVENQKEREEKERIEQQRRLEQQQKDQQRRQEKEREKAAKEKAEAEKKAEAEARARQRENEQREKEEQREHKVRLKEEQRERERQEKERLRLVEQREKEKQRQEEQRQKEQRRQERAEARARRPQLVKANTFYLLPMAQVGKLMGAGLAVGGHIGGFNAELAYLLGLGSSESLYWNYTGSDDHQPVECVYKPSILSLRLGYGIVFGKQFRLTPQAGIDLVPVIADKSKTSVTCGTVSLRADFALAKGFGLFVAPQYSFAAKKGEIYQQIESLSDEISGWGSGPGVRAGLMIFF